MTRGDTPDETRAKRAQKQKRRREAARRTLRETRRRLARRERRLDRGALPDFLIIGTEKGGTTFLFWTLCRHPHVEPAAKKELNFFSGAKWSKKGVGWYRSQFPAPAWRDGRRVITGEATPYYLFYPHSARRVAQTVPRVKLIALLRDPVDRAHSSYNHRQVLGAEDLDFEGALAEEENRTAGEMERMLSDEGYYSRRLRRYAYLSRGIYADQLQRWHEHFARDQLLVLRSEDLFADPRGTVGIVHEFLGLPEGGADAAFPLVKRNRRTFQPMDAATRRRLEQFFAPHNERLYEYLGRDFGW